MTDSNEDEETTTSTSPAPARRRRRRARRWCAPRWPGRSLPAWGSRACPPRPSPSSPASAPTSRCPPCNGEFGATRRMVKQRVEKKRKNRRTTNEKNKRRERASAFPGRCNPSPPPTPSCIFVFSDTRQVRLWRVLFMNARGLGEANARGWIDVCLMWRVKPGHAAHLTFVTKVSRKASSSQKCPPNPNQRA